MQILLQMREQISLCPVGLYPPPSPSGVFWEEVFCLH